MQFGGFDSLSSSVCRPRKLMAVVVLMVAMLMMLRVEMNGVNAARILDSELHAELEAKEANQQSDQQQLQGDETSAENGEAAGEAGAPGAANGNSQQAMQNMAGMGITVVLRNRNHIRTIQDKSAVHAMREEGHKQRNAEQRRKRSQRDKERREAEKRRRMEELEEKEDSDKAESKSKSNTEQTVKNVAKEAQDRQDRANENALKAQQRRDAETRRREEKEEQEDKQRAKEKEKKDEEKKKKDEQEQKGVVRRKQFKPHRHHVVMEPSDRRLIVDSVFSYMFWVRPNAKTPDWSNIFHKGSHNGERNPAVWFYPGQTRLHIRSSSSQSHNNGCDPNIQLTIGEWTHVAFTHSPSGIQVFYNGREECRTNYGGIVTNGGPLYISDPWYEHAACDLADFRMLNRAVELSEIQEAVSSKLGIEN